jgi:hypothetical protein
MPFLVDLGRLCRLGRLHQRLHGVDPFVKCERRRIGAPPVAGLIAVSGEKVKQMRAFLGG